VVCGVSALPFSPLIRFSLDLIQSPHLNLREIAVSVLLKLPNSEALPLISRLFPILQNPQTNSTIGQSICRLIGLYGRRVHSPPVQSDDPDISKVPASTHCLVSTWYLLLAGPGMPVAFMPHPPIPSLFTARKLTFVFLAFMERNLGRSQNVVPK
jgi:hypothetical protein